MRKSVAITLAVSSLLVAATPASAGGSPPPPCPTVTSNTTLNKDCVGPLRIAASNVKVNLNRKVVTCRGADVTGVEVVEVDNVQIYNGGVVSCRQGIVVIDGVGHRFYNLVVGGHKLSGIQGSRLVGIRLDNIAVGYNGGNGLALGVDADVDVNRVISSHNGDFGISLISTGGRIRNSAVTHNRTGVFVRGNNNTISGIYAKRNSLNGIEFEGPGGPAVGNLIENSEARENGQYGIVAELPASSNTIRGNEAYDNTVFDLFDGNPACDSNVWTDNLFGTANQACLGTPSPDPDDDDD